MTDEEWRPVVGWEGLYEVSSLGRVKRVSSLKSNRVGKVLTGVADKNGYRMYHLRDGGRSRTYSAHRLVALAHIPNPDELPYVLHGPAGVSDNSTANLRWGTNSDNMRDRRRDGTDFEVNKTHCPQGHEYTGDNIIWNNSEKTQRKCRICHNSRRWKGEEPDYNPVRNFKVTPEIVRAIREMKGAGVPQHEIGRMYGVSPMTVSLIQQGKTWKNVE